MIETIPGAIKSPFIDKNGTSIYVGDVIKYTENVRTGTSVHTIRRRRESFAVYSDIELIGTVRFGLYHSPLLGEIATFFVETKQEASYNSYFFCTSNRDRPSVHIDNLSSILSAKIAGKCLVLGRMSE